MMGMRIAALACTWLIACDFAVSAELPDGATDPADSGVDADERPRELRGVWITRFAFASATDLEAIIDRAADANFNAVFVQIRGEGDAYYRSAHEPWARRLSGVLGRDPGWDPLQVAIDRAHARGLELHAYFNVFSAWPATQAVPQAEGTIQHALRAHPEWLAVDSSGTSRDGEYRWFAPGNSALRAHIVATARDLVSNYAVDGLHLDRIRTPGPDYSRDTVTLAAFDAARAEQPGLSFADFMRGQVSAMVAELYAMLAETKPGVRLSAAVWGIYRALPGCATSQGVADYYQDSLGWAAAGSIDALVPMIYWPIEPGACTDWRTLLDGFLAGAAGRHIWAGMHALDDNSWQLPQIQSRIDRARAASAAGNVIFASAYLDTDPQRWAELGTSAYREAAAVPTMPWKP
jgi:uncharacterized lipoprotein YddW (UPF0748 family)